MLDLASAPSLPVPPCFDIYDCNAAESWKEWRSRWECYATAKELHKKDGEVQVSVLLTVIGAEAHKVFRTFQLTADQQRNVKVVLDTFERHCQPLKNTAFERYKFNMRGQQPGETFEQYLTCLRQLALRCDYENITPEQIIRDRIMFGITDNKVSDRLLREKDLTLERILVICRASEVSISQQKEVSKIQEGHIHSVDVRESRQPANSMPVAGKGKNYFGWITDCRFCGKDHIRSKESCPAWEKTCSRYQRKNHFATKCALFRKSEVRPGTRRINAIGETSSENVDGDISEGELQVISVSSVKMKEEQTVTLKLRPKCYIKFQIDSGANCNILPLHVYRAATGDEKLEKLVLQTQCCTDMDKLGQNQLGR